MRKTNKKRIALIVALAMMVTIMIPSGFAFAKVENADQTEVSDVETTVNDQEESVSETDQNAEDTVAPQDEENAEVPQDEANADDPQTDDGTEPAQEDEPVIPEDPENQQSETDDPEEVIDPVIVPENGFMEENGEVTYYRKGKKVTGFHNIDGERYYFDKETGYMVRGIQKIGKHTYCFDEEIGILLRGIQTVDEEQYYFSEKSGRMLYGFRVIDDQTYYFSKKTGCMMKGLQTISGAKYFFDREDGHRLTGIVKDGTRTRYFDPESGKMVKGFVKVDNDTYYFKKSNGRMATGLKKIEGNKYYFNEESGKMYHGFRKMNGYKYYFGKKTGRMVHGFIKIKGSRYYFGKKSGKMFTGLHRIGKDIYTFAKNGKQKRVVYGNKKAICLTWDDGPSENTTKIMNSLIANGGRGTFFVCGNRVDAYSKALKKNYKAGNQIGNHTWSHPVLSNLSAQDIKDQISSTAKRVKKYTGEKPKICRTPYGINTEYVRTNVNLPIILWSVDTLDWKTRNADSTYNSIMNSAKDGAVVLMHDLYPETAAAAVRAIPALVDKGYQLVTVDEMAMIKGYKLKNATVYYNFN